jgi:large subunit ribosomal protein L31
LGGGVGAIEGPGAGLPYPDAGRAKPDGAGIGGAAFAGLASAAGLAEGSASGGGDGGGVAPMAGAVAPTEAASAAASAPPARRVKIEFGFTSFRFETGARGPSCGGCYNAKAVKDKIHPKWYPEARVHCACGSTFTTGSTMPEIGVEICAACHPLFTGQQKLIDTAGRVDKFNQRAAAAKRKQEEAAARQATREAQQAARA